MNEIPKNISNIPQQPQKIDQVKSETVQEPVQPVVENQTKEIKEIPENPADRSSVKVDNLENDMKVFASNPELAAKAMDVAQLAEQRYAASGDENPELKSLAVSKAFVDEFQR